AKLSIDPFTGADGTTELPFIWADNLITETSSNFTSATTMNIRGISIIKDDLVLDGYNSDVNLLSGAYIGYTGTHSAKGSAIMINGSGSSLNLSGLSSLMLAGRANVSVDNTVSPADKNAVTDILTGESVAIKSDQKAYLIPGRFLRDILHNPVTKADTDAFGTPVVDFGLNPQPGDLNYNSYVSPSTKFKIAAKQTGEGSAASTLRYYYLNFAGGKLADQYLQDYIAMSSLDNMEPFTLDSLVLPPADNIKAVGNVMSYPGSGGSVKLTKGLSNAYSSDSELDNAFQSFGLNGDAFIGTALQGETVGKLANDYSKMTHLLTLTDSDKVYQESDQVVGSMIKAGGVSYITKEENNISLSGTDYELMKSERDKNLTDIDPAKQYITVVDGNLTVPAGKVLNGFFIASGDILIGNNVTINGIVISSGEKNASGDITLGNNITVNGRIVARNDIILGTDCVIRTNDSSEAFMKSIFENEGSFLENLFRNMKMTINFTESLPASNLVDLSDMISYENWHRTE
ncbi:MAG TPA: hypothetical protein VN131_01325, partial [Mobilitalea sp.]|nr:hypothetical protein [Mobilitalea sp.]